MSIAGNGENDNEVLTENKVPPSQPTTEKLEEAISTILRAALYTSKHDL